MVNLIKQVQQSWLTRGTSPEPNVVDVYNVKPRPGDPDIVVPAYRDDLRKNAAETSAVTDAIGDREAAKKQVIDDFAARRDRGLSQPETIVTKSGVKTRWPVTRVDADSSGYTEPVAPDPWDVLVSLHHDEFLGRALKQVDEFFDNHEGLTLSPTERRKRLAKLQANRLEIERLECAAIWDADAAGKIIPFRVSTDPRAVLGITVGPSPRRE